MRMHIFIIAIASLLLAFGCVSAPAGGKNESGSETPPQLPDFEVSVSRGRGLSPVAWSDTIIISSNGTVRRMHAVGGFVVNRTMALGAAELEEVRKQLSEADLSELDVEYSCRQNCPADLPGTRINITYGATAKSVYIYMPESVPTIIMQLDRKAYELSLRFGAEQGEFCGGIAAFQCAEGLECVLDGAFPDAGGICSAPGGNLSALSNI